MIVFCILLISMFYYFRKHISPKEPVTLYPFFMVLIWIMANCTQEISLFKLYFVQLIAIVCGSCLSLLRKQHFA